MTRFALRSRPLAWPVGHNRAAPRFFAVPAPSWPAGVFPIGTGNVILRHRSASSRDMPARRGDAWGGNVHRRGSLFRRPAAKRGKVKAHGGIAVTLASRCDVHPPSTLRLKTISALRIGERRERKTKLLGAEARQAAATRINFTFGVERFPKSVTRLSDQKRDQQRSESVFRFI
jgi:hypothetical protein